MGVNKKFWVIHGSAGIGKDSLDKIIEGVFF